MSEEVKPLTAREIAEKIISENPFGWPESEGVEELTPDQERHVEVIAEAIATRNATITDLQAKLAEHEKVSFLAERVYPKLEPTGACSIHRDGYYKCSMCYPDWRALIDAHVEAHNETRGKLAAATIDVAALEKAVDERDSAEEAMSQAYYVVTGKSPEWSNLFGYEQANEEIADVVAVLKQVAKTATIDVAAWDGMAAKLAASEERVKQAGLQVDEERDNLMYVCDTAWAELERGGQDPKDKTLSMSSAIRSIVDYNTALRAECVATRAAVPQDGGDWIRIEDCKSSTGLFGGERITAMLAARRVTDALDKLNTPPAPLQSQGGNEAVDGNEATNANEVQP